MQRRPNDDLESPLDARGWRFHAISTADRPERQARLKAEFERFGAPMELHVGVRPADAGGFHNAGYRGCFESHLACLRAAREQGARVAVIAEDDVLIVGRARRKLLEIADELDTLEWSIAYLGYLRRSSPCFRQRLRLVTRHVALSDGWEVRGTHFMAINGSALDDLIDNFEQRLLPGGHRIAADGVLNEFRRDMRHPTLLCMPNLAMQAPSPSGISPSSSTRERLLHRSRVRSWVEAVKRVALNAASLLPPRLHVAIWNISTDRS